MRNHILFYVKPRRYLTELHALFCQPEYRPLRDVKDLLPSLDCFANNTLKLDVSTRYLQKIVERFQVAWYDKDAMKQKEVVSNDKTQRSAAPCKASGLRRLHGVKIVA